jgi:hypothetical protein
MRGMATPEGTCRSRFGTGQGAFSRPIVCGFLNRVPQVRILPGAPSPTTRAPSTSMNAGQAGLRRVQP